MFSIFHTFSMFRLRCVLFLLIVFMIFPFLVYFAKKLNFPNFFIFYALKLSLSFSMFLLYLHVTLLFFLEMFRCFVVFAQIFQWRFFFNVFLFSVLVTCLQLLHCSSYVFMQLCICLSVFSELRACVQFFVLFAFVGFCLIPVAPDDSLHRFCFFNVLR